MNWSDWLSLGLSVALIAALAWWVSHRVTMPAIVAAERVFEWWFKL